MTEAPGLAWRDAVTALDLVETAKLSLIVRARAGPVRDALLARLGATMRITADSDVETLAGGRDLLGSLARGQVVMRQPLAERLAGRVLIVAGAERLPEATAALLADLIDARGAGVVLLDEGIDERVPEMLADRVAMLVDLDLVSIRDVELLVPHRHAGPVPASTVPENLNVRDLRLGGPRNKSGVTARDETVSHRPENRLPLLDDPVAALCEVAAALAIGSLRAPLQALAVAQACAARLGRTVTEDDAALSVRLTLAPRARCVPDDEAPLPEPAEGNGQTDTADKAAEDRLLDAARAAIPAGLLAAIDRRGGSGRRGGSVSARRGTGARGRLGRIRPGLPRRGARLDLTATLIAAAPMQRLRERGADAPLAIRKADIRVRRRQPRQVAVTIFTVDASGSAAVSRLAEVKGAVEQLLAESYVRRDEAALIAFRGQGAETLLPPTRALARAKRELAALPGGGPTPLAAGIVAALEQAIRSRAAGRAPLILLVTDGGANVARDGTTGRARAIEDAEAAATLVAAAGIDALVVDSAPRGQARVERLAAAMCGRYVALPRLDDAVLAGLAARRR